MEHSCIIKINILLFITWFIIYYILKKIVAHTLFTSWKNTLFILFFGDATVSLVDYGRDSAPVSHRLDFILGVPSCPRCVRGVPFRTRSRLGRMRYFKFARFWYWTYISYWYPSIPWRFVWDFRVMDDASNHDIITLIISPTRVLLV